MARRILTVCSLFVAALPRVAAISAESLDISDCDAINAVEACSSSAIEAREEQETNAATVELLQSHKSKVQGHSSAQVEVSQASAQHEGEGESKKENVSAASLVTKDSNGNVCMLCNKPLPERVNKVYTEFREDCGRLSTPTGPSASTMTTPVSNLAQVSGKGVETNAFCELNFAKSCADAIANKDYLYWAKSIDFKASGSRENSAWDGRYCQKNGFLQSSVKALQHDFTATQAKARDLCKTKYAKYNIHNITFKDMMAAARYDDTNAPSLADAEMLAAWNCAMGDLGCDMALCAYSFCEKDSGVGLYDECQGWHPVHGMPAHF